MTGVVLVFQRGEVLFKSGVLTARIRYVFIFEIDQEMEAGQVFGRTDKLYYYIDIFFRFQQQQAPPINSISTAAVTTTNSTSPIASGLLGDQKQIPPPQSQQSQSGKMSCQEQSNGFSTFHVT